MRYGEVKLKTVESKDIIGTDADGLVKLAAPAAGNGDKFLKVSSDGTIYEYSYATYAP